MKKILTILFASSAMTAAVSLPAWSAVNAPANANLQPIAALFEEGSPSLPLVLASDDDDDDDNRRSREGSRRSHDNDDDGKDHDDEDEDDDDDDDKRGGASNPAPAGTVAPPKNGLFGNGVPPKVKVN